MKTFNHLVDIVKNFTIESADLRVETSEGQYGIFFVTVNELSICCTNLVQMREIRWPDG
jgi:hypothetical protein